MYRRQLTPSKVLEEVNVGLFLCENELHFLSRLEVSKGGLIDQVFALHLDVLKVPDLILFELSVEPLLLFFSELINSLYDMSPFADVMTRVVLICF